MINLIQLTLDRQTDIACADISENTIREKRTFYEFFVCGIKNPVLFIKLELNKAK